MAKKRTVEKKTVEIRSPFDEVAAEVSSPPAPTGGLTSSASPKKTTAAKAKATTAKAVSEPAAVAAGSSKPKKATKKAALVTTKTGPEAKATGSSPVKKETKRNTKKATKKSTLDVTAELAVTEPQVELSPIFKALAEPTLPKLERENRARLMMQTPTKLYFYWSIRENPYHLLRRAFGDDLGSYSLVLKLTEQKSGVEEIHRAEPEGDWWFNVEPDGKYEAEIGFYAPNRPYFRIIYSNTVETPRRSPSPHLATEAHWRVPAHKFAEVLDVAGFSQDAFDVAMAGDDHETAQQITHTAFSRFIGNGHHDLRGIAAEDIRYTLIALASGLRIEELRSRISATLFTILQANAERIAAGNAMSVLTEYFDIDETEFTERQSGSAVHGASLVNFPRTLQTRRIMPVSSHSFR